MIVSVMLLPIFEVEANRQAGTYYGDRIFGAIGAALRDSSWVRRWSHWVLRPASCIIFSIEASFECQILKCVRRRVVCWRAPIDRVGRKGL